MSTEKTSYTDEELQEFKDLILHKLDQAIKDYELLRGSATNSSENDVADTLPTFKAVHEGAASLRRIENKTYGICRETGKLIPKERLRAVPHATLSIEAKLNEKK